MPVQNMLGDLALDETLQNRLPLTPEGLLHVDEEVMVLLRAIASGLLMPRNHDQANNSDRVTVVNTVATTVTTITTLTNLTQFNGVQAHQMSVASEINAWYNACRQNIV